MSRTAVAEKDALDHIANCGHHRLARPGFVFEHRDQSDCKFNFGNVYEYAEVAMFDDDSGHKLPGAQTAHG